MSHDTQMSGELRTKLGSRDARKLRAEGRIPCSLQFDGEADQPLRHFHISEDEFLASRRHDVHLYDFQIGGDTLSAVVRELQWDALGSNLVHVDFKGVHRGQKTEVVVPLSTYGNASGVVNIIKDSVHIICLPSQIPDSVEIKLDGLEIGAHLHVNDLELPEGSELTEGEAKDNELVLSVIDETVAEEPAEGEGDDEGGEPEVIGEKKDDE